MPKEDRSDWVAVAPEHSGTTQQSATIRPASSAYQFFQRDVTEDVKEELQNSGDGKFNVGQFSRAVRDKWSNLDAIKKARYEDMARDDAVRFARESHLADVAKLEEQERRRQERNETTLYMDNEKSGGRSTRKYIKKQQRKQERRDHKKQKQQRQLAGDDSDYNSNNDNDDDSYSSSDDSSSYDSDDSDRPRKKKKKQAAPRQVSKAVQERRNRERLEREEKDQYIAQRQEELRKDRAVQAKRRLDFLLKQSDIFSHFGTVKEDQGRLKTSRKAAASANASTDGGDGSSRRRDSSVDNDGVDAAEMEESDEHKATFLTAQPSTLGFGKMREYQLEGLNWMIRLQEHGVNGILADEMGLGKTLQSISILVYMMEFQNCTGPHLIVVPKSTLSNWMMELEKWAPTLTAVRFHGSKDDREDIAKTVLQPGQRDEDRTWHVCVTTYEVCNIEQKVLNKFAWSYLIIDEAHRLKNEASAFSRTIRTFETRYRLLLTGTPLQNNLHELWALLNFLVPDVFASAEQFDEWFNLDIDDANEKNKLISQLHKILRPFMLRRLKADVEKSLPPKHETILFTGMSVMQKKLYKDILMRDIDTLQGGSGSRTAILNIVMQLRKCAGHPYLFPGVEDRSLPPLGEHLVESCGKMVLLDKLLKRLQEKGHRVLLFTQMTRVLDILEDYMVMRRFQYCRIDGNTSYELREERIDAFNEPDSKKFLFLLSTRAGGLGINLQTADVVILYDSDWNPQADLQAQDRAHRIGQKREVQVFRFVTEHTIEEKIVERAQQKLKLDAMVVQQGRLNEKDKLSRDELLEAVRFGADKVFKTKDSSITNDDIDLILDQGKRKTQELNEKLQSADKGDLLDFKLEGGLATQTFEGVDYSGAALAQLKEAKAQAEILGMLDIGKRERRQANYNENTLYQQQVAMQGGKVKERRKREKKLPKFLRLPRMEEWQMFQRSRLQKLQEKEEGIFRSLPEEQQKAAYANDGLKPTEVEQDGKTTEEATDATGSSTADINTLPPLLSDEEKEEKTRLLSEGFADWRRENYTAFVKANAKYGRNQLSKIAIEVGKPQCAVEAYAAAFWDVNIGKERFSEHEYDRVVKLIEKGEKRIEDTKRLERGTRVFLGLFDNPWEELEFSHTNCKDKMFTADEDRHLLCWTHKYGYGQWDAIKMAIRRSPDFRLDYFLRSLPADSIGRRCEQLMKAAEKEVEFLEKKAREDAGLVVEEEKKEDNQTMDNDNNDGKNKEQEQQADLPPVVLPKYKVIRAQKRIDEQKQIETERQRLEANVKDLEDQMRKMQNRLKELQEYSKEAATTSGRTTATMSTVVTGEFPDDLIPNLVNLLAQSGAAGIMSISNQFIYDHPDQVSKRQTCFKIEEVAIKEKREEDGDTKPVWHIRDKYKHMLDADTVSFLQKTKVDGLKKIEQKKKNDEAAAAAEDNDNQDENGAIVGSSGDFVPFPEYDGTEPPRECKKAFTHFCNKTRKEVKHSLDPSMRKDKQKVNSILKERWFSLTDDDKVEWKGWESWDKKRFARDNAIYERKQNEDSIDNNDNTGSGNDTSGEGGGNDVEDTIHIPKKKKEIDSSNISSSSIPKKRRIL